ncbi:MAG: hypothetical protein M0031_10705 [Thermaerobacter sp.]|nr:hypothetical protein [Thermaerobacter sp.]
MHLDAITPSELQEVVALLGGVPGELAARLGRRGWQRPGRRSRAW